MERKTHMLFTISWIYGLKVLFQKYGIDTSFAIFYISLVGSFPLISVPFQLIATSLADADVYSTRLRRTILLPAVLIVLFITKHRGATHDIRGISIVAAALYWLYIIGTNIFLVALIAFLSITITIVLIDDFRILWFKTNIVEYLLVFVILVFWPVLLIPVVYNLFLVSVFFWYVWHMFGDAPTKEWWNPFMTNKLKFQLPSIFAFTVWWFIERILQRVLICALISIIWIDKSFWMNKIENDLLLVKNEYIYLYKNPEVLISDYNSVESKVEATRIFLSNANAILQENITKLKELKK